MMKRTSVLFSLAVLASFGSASIAQAQVANPLKFTVFAGLAQPTGDMSDAVKSGYNVGGALDFHAPLSPLGLRGEGLYSSFGAKETGGADDASFSDLGVNANAVFWLPNAGSPVKAYLTGGPSFSRLKVAASSGGLNVSATENHWGFNLGGGLDFALGALSTRVDLRYRRISSDGDAIAYIPITFGVTF